MNSYFKNNIFSISFATSLSKLAGFLRQIFIAAAFGIGITYDAFNYAYIIPGFFIIIICGINGPLHNSVVAVLTPLNDKDGALTLTRVSIKLTLLFFFISIIVYFSSGYLINLLGPHLSIETKNIATTQLKILAPCIPMAAFIGLSFGALNSRNKFFISSLSPAFTSLVTVMFILISWILNYQNTNPIFFYTSLLAFATLIGTFVQFFIQIWEINNLGLFRLSTSWNFNKKEDKRILDLIIPTSISSGLGQINVFIDMFFASNFVGAASGLAYGNFLIQAPLGILSNALILPLLPKFSEFNSKGEKKNLEKYLITAIEYSFFATLFLSGFLITFSNELVKFIFERGAFNYDAVFLVKNILIAYAIGIPFYLLRDLLVRTYYSIERTNLPFKLSLAGIFLNIIFDWLLIGAPISNFGNLFPFNLGVIGIILSSGLVNFIICFFLSLNLKTHNIDLPKIFLFRKIIYISISSIATSVICYLVMKNIEVSQSYFLNLFVLILGFLTFSITYFLFTKFLKVNKFNFKRNKN